MSLKSIPFDTYCLMSLFAFSTVPFCQEAYESEKYTMTILSAFVMFPCAQNSLPFSVVIVFTPSYMYAVWQQQPDGNLYGVHGFLSVAIVQIVSDGDAGRSQRPL